MREPLRGCEGGPSRELQQAGASFQHARSVGPDKWANPRVNEVADMAECDVDRPEGYHPCVIEYLHIAHDRERDFGGDLPVLDGDVAGVDEFASVDNSTAVIDEIADIREVNRGTRTTN